MTFYRRITTGVTMVFLFSAIMLVGPRSLAQVSSGAMCGPADCIHGLTELSKRHIANKPYSLFMNPTSGDYPSERVIFKDTATNTTLWKMSRNPGYNIHQYSNIPVWNKDGSQLAVFSMRQTPSGVNGLVWRLAGQGGGVWRLEPDGSRWHYFKTPLSDPSFSSPEFSQWSPSDSHTAYTYKEHSGKVYIRSVNYKTNQTSTFLNQQTNSHQGGMDLSPQYGSRLLYTDYVGNKSPAAVSHAWLINGDGGGASQGCDLARPIHQAWFLKRPDYSFTFNYQNSPVHPIDGQYVCQGGSVRQISSKHFTHLAVSPNGRYIAHIEGVNGLVLTKLKDNFQIDSQRTLVDSIPEGHISWEVSNDWLVYSKGLLYNAPFTINVFNLTNNTSATICYTNTHGFKSDNSGIYQAQVYPESSPDGTKIAYDSSMLDFGDKKNVDFYIAIQKLPDPPQNVTLSGTTLSWQPPVHRKELAGYYVYDSHGRQVNPVLLTGTQFQVPDPSETYEVTAVDHSGLESKRNKYHVAPSAPTKLKLFPLNSDNAVRITWQASPTLDVAYYNVYCGENEVQVDQAHRIASTIDTQTIDWGLPQGPAIERCLVTAVSRQGDESDPVKL